MEGLFTKAVDILYLAKQNGVEIILKDGRLQLKFPENKAIDDDLLAEIRANKQLIIDFLSSDNWDSSASGNDSNKIKPVDRTNISRLPLSYSQERLWFIDSLEGSVQYHIPAVLRLKGRLNEQALEETLRTIIERHEVLRTTIHEDETGKGYQMIRTAANWKLNRREHLTDEELTKLIAAPFDLSKDYMLRADLAKTATEDHTLIVTMHHIASDAWSMPVLVREVAALYEQYTTDKPAKLPGLTIQYADYAIWQRGYLEGELLEEKLNYWKEKLEDLSPLQLPADGIRPEDSSTRGTTIQFGIDPEVAVGLRKLSRAQGTTLYMTLLAAFKVLLYRYSGQEDICVGTSIAGRPQQELEELIGFFVNTLALRSQVKGEESFSTVLQTVRQTMLEAYAHQEVPFEKVVEAVVKERTGGGNPLFQVMLVLGNTPDVPELKLGDLVLSGEHHEQTAVKFDLTFFITETSKGLSGSVQYNTDLYDQGRMIRMTEHFTALLKSITEDPERKAGELNLLSSAEREQLTSYQSSETRTSTHTTVTEIFAAIAKTHKEDLAVKGEEGELSYGALETRSNQLAHYLKEKGVRKGTAVPLLLPRGTELIIGILGILKAGGAYVPIDAEFPAERVSYMLQDTGAKVAVSNSSSSDKLQGTGITVIELDEERAQLRRQPVTAPANDLQPQDRAYIIYTSGSTGRPKGVPISHGNLADYYYGIEESIKISKSKSFALVSSAATDLGNTVLYGSLLSGGLLHVLTKEAVSHIEGIHAYFAENGIDCVKIVPSHWEALSLEGRPLLPKELLIFGGEALQGTSLNRIRAADPRVRVVNHYGPTETTIGKLLHETEKDKEYQATVPIGRPFGNTRTYVLSKELQLCPVGVPGQLYIAGAGLSEGYINNEALTEEKFIADPFTGTGKMYGTGDRVQYDREGNITFIGRVDDQVKIRGYRVEPGEVARVLGGHTQVRQAYVLAKADKQGNMQLTGYYVPREEEAAANNNNNNKEELQAYLKDQLPEYMVPGQLIALSELPLTANGKVDRKALPETEEGEADKDSYQGPRTETETRLQQLWEEVLETDQISVTADFFGIGGHSLLAVRLISAIRKQFQRELAISEVFDYPTIEKLSARIDAAAGDQGTKALLPQVTKATPRPEKIPLSFSQERLWFIDSLEGSVQYHIPAVLRLKGKLDIAALEKTLQTIVERHEVLRTVIREQEGQGYQEVIGAEDWSLGVTDHRNESEEQLRPYIVKLIGVPYDLGRDYMLRADLLEIAEEDHMLVITMHHIASDGWSRSILVKEVVALYETYTTDKPANLPPLPVQYADYAVWQREYMQGAVLEEKLNYWKEQLRDTAALQLPTDHNRPSVPGTNGAGVSLKIDRARTAQLQALSHANGATLYMTLLSAFKVLLYRYSNQEDICVGTPVAGRQQQETEGLIGFFINTLAIRSRVRGEASFTTLLQEVKQTTLAAYAHQEVPFEKVVDAVVKERDLSRSPLFQVMFVLSNTPDVPELKFGDVELSLEMQAHTTAKFDLSLSLLETAEGLQGTIEYNTDLYDRETIVRMKVHFTELLASVVAAPSLPVSKTGMLTTGEEYQLLAEFRGSSSAYPQDKSLTELFEAQAERTPDATALIHGNEELTYRELNERSNQLARYLKGKGVTKETLVPVCIERSVAMMTGILGILKAGGAYVPIDPEYPDERIGYMLEDTGAKVAVSSGSSSARLTNVEVIDLDRDESEIAKKAKTDLADKPQSNQLAYVIYTSGSTGRPKGVMIEHKGVVNLITAQTKFFNISSDERILQFYNYCFDASVEQIFLAFLNGASLITFREGLQLDIRLFEDFLIEKKITHFDATPLYLENIHTKNYKNLKRVIAGGEVCKKELADRWINKLNFYNGYGPTETTVTAIEYNYNKYNGSTVPIGKPVNNVPVCILDANKQLVPIGVTGEINIGGVQVARGYLNQNELTAEKFVKDPFGKNAQDRLYKTGDLGKWLPDGNIAYVGRLDDQVKIRGYRIELGEIETILNQHPEVSHGLVLAKKDNNGNDRLVAYIVPEVIFDKEVLISFLHEKLPDYMVPSLWIALDQLPTTSSGKIDRLALPEPDMSELQSHVYVAPHNETEHALAEIWQKLLGVEKVGIHDNYFELGGHSILAIRVVAAIRKELSMELSIKDLFVYPTVAMLSAHLLGQYKSKLRSLIPIKSTGSKPPLYIICGAGGTVFKFREFAGMLDPDQPVYGLQQAVSDNNADEFPETIQEVAARYIEEIVSENPEGPYALAGHCLGGTIAFEMANQLESMSKKVTMLAMFDANVREKREIVRPSLRNLYHLPTVLKRSISTLPVKLKFELFLLTKHPKQALQYKIRKVRPWFTHPEPKPEDIDQEVFDKLTLKLERALIKYEISGQQSREILLFNATQDYYFIDTVNKIIYKELAVNNAGKYAWKKYAGSIRSYEVKGEHSTMFEPENAVEFSRVLQQHLDEDNR